MSTAAPHPAPSAVVPRSLTRERQQGGQDQRVITPYYKSLRSAQPFLCGGLSACFATGIIHPIDLAKVRLQLYSTLNPGVPKPPVWQVISSTVAKDGLAAAYAGLSASQLRAAVYGTARLGMYGTFKEMTEGATFAPLWVINIGTAMTAGALATMVGNPFDVALVRMQADTMKPEAQRRNYKHVIDALLRITREEGPRKLYSGIQAAVGRAMAMNTGQLAGNDVAKRLLIEHVTHDLDPKKPSVQTEIMAAVAAGVFAATLSLPFDMLKSRLQDQRPVPETGKMPYAGMIDCGMQIVKKEGPLALWTGYTAWLSRVTPHAIIVLLTQAFLNRKYQAAIEQYKYS